MHVNLIHAKSWTPFKPSFFFLTNRITYSSSSYNPISHYFSLLHSSPNARTLQHLHARLLRNSFYTHVLLSSKLILMYSKHKKILPDSHSVFRHMPFRNSYSWNIMIGELSRSGFPQRSIGLFSEMQNSGLLPDVFTLPLVLRACASIGDLQRGMAVHGICVKMGFKKNVFVASAVVFLYVNLAKTFNARSMFDEMDERDAVLWTSMVGGYAQNGEPLLALEVFKEMVGNGVELDGVVMVSLLLAISQLGWLMLGKSVHGWSVRRHFWLEMNVGNALVDMYVKCGALHWAHRVFHNMPERDVISWSSMISGYGLNGPVEIALELFQRMKREGIEPNSITFLGVLSACSHAGMVDEAWNFFNVMRDYEVVPQLKHYACMVDVLGRAGLLVEAERFIEETPIEPDGSIWGAILAGCRVHGDVEVGERVARKLL